MIIQKQFLRQLKNFIKSKPYYIPDFLKKLYISLHLLKFHREMENSLTPRCIYIFLTNKCNQRCRHCFYWQELNQKSEELSIKDLQKLASSIKGPTHVGLTGGEPFMRDDIPQICKILNDTGKVEDIGVATNGFFAEKILKNTQDILRSCNLTNLRIQISLDGMEETHDKIREQGGSFNKAIETFKKLNELVKKHINFRVEFLMTMMLENLGDIMSLINYCSKLNASIRFHLIRAPYFGTRFVDKDILSSLGPKEINLSSEQVEKFSKTISEIVEMNNKSTAKFLTKDNELLLKYSISILKNGKSPIRCMAPFAECVVFPDGKISFCETTKPFTSLKAVDYDLQKAWRSKDANNMRERLTRCICAHSCNLQFALYFNKESLKRIYVQQ